MRSGDLVCVAGTARAARRLARLEARGGTPGDRVERDVRKIVAAVRRGGDRALLALTRRLDGVRLAPRELALSRDAMAAAYRSLPARVRRDLDLAARRVRAFHRRQREASWSFRDPSGARLGQMIAPLGRVGVYVPGGRAAYPSTVLMTAIPARVAGVGEVIAVSPAGRDGVRPIVAAACHVAEVDVLYRVGGAQAIAALAYGTRTVPRVDKIVGPGNVWVATAKRLCFGAVDIDAIAGPSEVVVIADGRADPELVAADMLAQAEHDPLAAAVCLTADRRLARRVAGALDRQLATLPRRAIAARSLERFGAIVVTRSLADAVALADRLAPEHLELLVRDPARWARRIRHAGAVFLGPWAPEAFGDYLAGPNHVLPTGGTARFASPLGVYDFVKRTSVIDARPRTLRRLGPPVVRLARLEGLEAHGRAVERRLAAMGGSSR
ncbi:MAG TPA: histidinol dehydrogenase [Candidatus Binatia bacterium]|nr:histidinol dehydrogenase [Candidatus Binatia bacterium]